MVAEANAGLPKKLPPTAKGTFWSNVLALIDVLKVSLSVALFVRSSFTVPLLKFALEITASCRL